MKKLFTITLIFLSCSIGFAQTEAPTKTVEPLSIESVKTLQPGAILYSAKMLFLYSKPTPKSKYTTIEPGQQVQFVEVSNPEMVKLRYNGKDFYSLLSGLALSNQAPTPKPSRVVATTAQQNSNTPNFTEAGQLLIKHQQVFLHGVAIGFGGAAISGASYFLKEEGKPMAIIGGVIGLIGTVITIDSHKYIKRAGLQLMNEGNGIGITRKF